MSQSILQNGYAILLANTSDLDRHLLAREQLLIRLSEIRTKKTAERDEAIAAREAQVAKIVGYIVTLGDNPSKIDTIKNMIELRRRLEMQVDILKNKTINATYDDVRETRAFFVNTTFRPLVPVAYGYSTVGVTPRPLFGSSCRLKIPIFGDFITDQALHVLLSSVNPTHKDNRVRWFDFIGHRMIKELRLVMNGVVLDRYGCEGMEMYYRFHMSKNQQNGWKRCVGQKTPIEATFLQDLPKQTVREKKLLYDGLQSAKQSHPETGLFISLLFWYNLNPAFALSNRNVAFDKFCIEVDFAEVDDCVTIVDFAGDGGLFVRPVILVCNLVTNHVYTMSVVAELFRHKMHFSIIRVHKRVERILNKPFDNVNINDIKHAVEGLYICFRPVSNESDENHAETWRINDVATYNEINYVPIISTGTNKSLAYTPTYYYSATLAVNRISFKPGGSTIDESRAGVFFSAYLPLRFGAENILTPSKEGTYLMTFGISPGEAQSSGYLNFINSRDQSDSYKSSYVSNDTPVSMSVCATSINFLLR